MNTEVSLVAKEIVCQLDSLIKKLGSEMNQSPSIRALTDEQKRAVRWNIRGTGWQLYLEIT